MERRVRALAETVDEGCERGDGEAGIALEDGVEGWLDFWGVLVDGLFSMFRGLVCFLGRTEFSASESLLAMLELRGSCVFAIVLVCFRGGGNVAAYVHIGGCGVDHGCCESGERQGGKLHDSRLR